MILWHDRIILKQHGFPSIYLFWLDKYSAESTRICTWWEMSQRPLRLQKTGTNHHQPKLSLLWRKWRLKYVPNFNRQKLCPENAFHHWKFNNKKGRSIISSKLLHAEAQLTTKNQNYIFFFPSKNLQNLITFPQATWEGEWEISLKIKTVRILLFLMESTSDRTIL